MRKMTREEFLLEMDEILDLKPDTLRGNEKLEELVCCPLKTDRCSRCNCIDVAQVRRTYRSYFRDTTLEGWDSNALISLIALAETNNSAQIVHNLIQ